MARTPKPWFWKARRAWYVTIAGSRICLGPEKRDAVAQFHQLMTQPRERRLSSCSLAAIADEFLEWVQKHRSPETYEWYRYRLERFIQKYPDLRATDVRPYHVERWVDEYPLSVTSRRNYLRSVKRCLKWAVRQGYLLANPVAELEVPAGEQKEVVITAVEFDRLMAYVRNGALADLISVTWETGCRPQESLRVEARQVDRTHQRWVLSKSESKTKRLARVVYLTGSALAVTERLMVAHPEGPIFRNANGKPWTTEAVNCAFLAIRQRMGKDEMKRRGEIVSEEDVQGLIPTLKPTRTRKGEVVPKTKAELRCEAKRKLAYKRACELAPRYSLYALRHSWATNALQKGIDPLTVAILMGHEDPSMLSKVYQHLSLNPGHMLEQACRAVG